MQKIASRTLPLLRIIYSCGAVVGIFIFGFVLVGIAKEAADLWREGPGMFFADVAMRLVFGAFVALLSAAPYLILGFAARKSGPPMFLAAVGILMLALQLFMTIQILFFTRGSTASIGVLFLPIYFLASAVAVWVLAALAQRFGFGQASK